MSFATEAADLGRRADDEITLLKSQAEQAVATVASLRGQLDAALARIAELESTPDPHNPDPEEPDPEPEPPVPSGYGTVGNRPRVLSKPDARTTGPRSPVTRTMTGPQALAAALSAPVEADGFRVLRNVRVTSMIQMNQPSHHSIAFEDCRIEAGTTSTGSENLAAVRGWHALRDVAPAGHWPEFRNCEIVDGHNASVLGGHVRLLRCDIHGGYDGVQIHRGIEVWASYVHDLWNGPNAHADGIQILGGLGSLVHASRIDGFGGDSSAPEYHGVPVNRCVQIGFGMMSSASAEFMGNWFDGGNYTIDSTDPMPSQYPVTLTWRGNLFGRRNKWGPIYRTPSARASFDRSNVWEDTGVPVLP